MSNWGRPLGGCSFDLQDRALLPRLLCRFRLRTRSIRLSSESALLLRPSSFALRPSCSHWRIVSGDASPDMPIPDVPPAPMTSGPPLPVHDSHAAQLEILNEIGRIATLDVELRPMLQRITDTLAARFGWELVACVTVDAERRAFVCEAVTSAGETVIRPGYSRPPRSGVVVEVSATGRP